MRPDNSYNAHFRNNTKKALTFEIMYNTQTSENLLYDKVNIVYLIQYHHFIRIASSYLFLQRNYRLLEYYINSHS